MAIGYDWINVGNWSVNKGQATLYVWVDVKLNRQDINGNYSVVDTRLNTTITNSLSGSGYNFLLTGSAGKSGSGVWYFTNETILTGQYVVAHDANGNATSTASGYVGNTYWGIDQWVSGSFSLPTIPRASTINSFTGTDITKTFKATYTAKSSAYTNKLRISIPGVKALEVFNNYVSGSNVYLSKASVDYIKNYTRNKTIQLGGVIETWYGGTKIGESSEIKITCNIRRDMYIMVNGTYKRATAYVRVGGSWKEARPYLRNNNQWKEGI